MRPSVWKPNLFKVSILMSGIGRQHRQQVPRRILDEVEIARLQRVHRGLRVRHGDPFDAVDLHDLAAGGPARRLLARHIVGVLLVDRLHARLELGLDELERAGADLLGDLLAGRRLGEPLRHHEGHIGRGLGDRLQHQAVGLLQFQHDGLGVGRLDAGGEIHQLLAHIVHAAPALQRGDAILRGNRRAVMPFQAVAQREGVGQLVVGDFPVRHLRLDLEVGIGRQQRVVDHVAVVAGDVGRGEQGIDDAQVRMHLHQQRLAAAAWPGSRRSRGQARKARGSSASATESLRREMSDIPSSPDVKLVKARSPCEHGVRYLCGLTRCKFS